MQEIADHFLLQKEPARASTYAQLPPIWWSDQARRWFVTEPGLIRQIMSDRGFSVPDYSVEVIMDRLNIDLAASMKMRDYLPLAWEGEKHKALRNRMTRIIAANTRPACELFQDQLRKNLSAALAKGCFCFVQDVIRPTMRATLLRLSGYPDPFDPDLLAIEVTAHIFDDRVSPRKRKHANEIIRTIVEKLPDEMTEEDKYSVAALNVVGSNSLLATLAQSLLHILSPNSGTMSSQMNWKIDMPVTGLPLIEKVCREERELQGHTIRPGDQLRLFIETGGLSDGTQGYSDLFFAAGPHRCSGMAVSRQIWAILGDEMSRIEKKFRVLQTSERQGDYVFNFLDKLEVEIHA
ncbi:hypothetical protein E2A64_12020 [Pseudohoeflea suaedae]|uniref:Cytochrome P450 n=1 Tax=Pseudohoeflea suaedae TaxID=877384 RepID=A0A4R5PJZ5_9HYPH|nr:hypothetical protein [Pseudohoeflea suaedae]TDH36021.1 hypothetical protein E2A64_12020 [Pseudohoeflea suaedae]